jgi:uncharacterized membrane protein
MATPQTLWYGRRVFERSVRAVLAFAVVIAAMAHALVSLSLALSPQFFAGNFAQPSDRNLVLGVVILTFVAAGLFGTALILRSAPREASTRSLDWWARRASPLVAFPFIAALFRHDFLTEIEAAILLGLIVIGFERLVRLSLEAKAEFPATSSGTNIVSALAAVAKRFLSSPRLTAGTLVGLAVAQCTLLAVWSIWSHQRFGTYGFDLGIYDNIFNSTLNGKWLAVTTMGMPAPWSDVRFNHADFAVFYLLPIYALRPGAVTLLVLQSIFIAGASIPLYLFARSRLSTGAAFAVGVAWLLYPALQSSQMYDYHPQHVGAAWVLCAVAALEYRRYWLYWVFFALAILVREDVSIGLTCLGLYSVLSGYRIKTGIASMVVACLYFVTLRFGVMQSGDFSGMYKNLFAPGAAPGFGSILMTLVSNPTYTAKTLLTMEKARYISQVFAPLAFLPMRRGLLWLLMIPGFFLTILSTEYLPTIQISFQYVANWGAYMFPAAVIVLGGYAATTGGTIRRRAAIAAMLCGSIIANYQWGAYSPRWTLRGGFVDVPLRPPAPADLDREAAVQHLLGKVPAEAKLCTGDRIQSHTTGTHINNWPLRFNVAGCEYLMWSDLPGDLGNNLAQAALSDGSFTLVEQRAGVTLAKAKAP